MRCEVVDVESLLPGQRMVIYMLAYRALATRVFEENRLFAVDELVTKTCDPSRRRLEVASVGDRNPEEHGEV